MPALIRRFFEESDAQGLVEYGMLLMLIAIICLAALDTVGINVVELLNPIGTTLGGISS